VTSRRDGTSRYYAVAIDELDVVGQRLWPVIREQVAASPTAQHDHRRRAGVLDRRRSQSAAFFASAAGQWDSTREELFGGSFQLHALLSLLDRDLVVGDLGCGTGKLTEVLASFARRVIAVDGSAEMLDAARRRFDGRDRIEIRSGTLEALPIDSGRLDLAVLGLVLHHVPDPAAVLNECHRVLRPGGRVLMIDMLPHDRAEYQQQMGHVWLGFSEKQLRKLLGAAGFGQSRVDPLPIDREAKGPALFTAVAEKHAAA